MRKIKVMGLAVLLTCFGLMSLGSGEASTGTTKAISSGESSEVAVDADDAVGKEDDAVKEDAAEDKKEKAAETTIEEQVLIDDDGLKITAKGYEPDPIWGDGIKLLIENDKDEDVSVGIDAVIVNDYMVSNFFSETVAAGKKVNSTLNLSNSELKAAGIDNVGQVEIRFHETNPETFTITKNFDMVTVKTSNYDKMDITANDAGMELYNDHDVRIVGKYVDENSIWGTAVLLYIENNSDEVVSVHCDDLSVNGFMVTPYFYCEVYPGKKAIDDITLSSSDLEENDISSVDEIELKFRLSDEDWSTIAESDPITFSAK